MDKLIRVLGIFGIIDLLELVERELERVDLPLELVHQFLRVSGLAEFQNLVVKFCAFFLALDLLLLLYVFLVGSLFSHMLVYQILKVHPNLYVNFICLMFTLKKSMETITLYRNY